MGRKIPKVLQKRRHRFQIEALESRRLLAAEFNYGNPRIRVQEQGPGDYQTVGGPNQLTRQSQYMGSPADGDYLVITTALADGDDSQAGEDEDVLPNPLINLQFTITRCPAFRAFMINTINIIL